MPGNQQEILARTAELGFGVALRQELRSLAVGQRLLADLPFVPRSLARLRDARLHIICAEDEFRALKGARRLDVDWDFLRGLHQLGQETACQWLRDNLASVGKSATVDLVQFAEPTLKQDIVSKNKVA